MSLPRLLLLTDRTQLPAGRTLTEQIERSVEAGATHVVLRELDLADGDRDALADEISAIGATVISAHRPVPHAAGLQESSVSIVRTFGRSANRPNVRTIEPRGRSCHSRAEVEAAMSAGCHYATLGPFAESASKPGYGPAIDRSDYRGLPIPTYALGGITADNAGEAMEAGAYGLAVMGSIMRAESPETLVREMLAALSSEKLNLEETS